MANQDLLERAVFYRDRGFSVIPVNKNKKPIIPWAEFQKRIVTVEEIGEWFSKFPDAQIGIVTGIISHLAVIDIDPRNGGNDDLFKDFNTPMAKTGSNGKHYYFSINTSVKTHTNLYKGIDLKADGGFIIAPTSVSDKGSYEWIKDIYEVPLLPLPEFVLERRKENGIKEDKSFSNSFNPEILQGVPEGQRNNAAASYAGHLFARYPVEEWETVCLEQIKIWNITRNNPPLSLEELMHTFNSIKSSELRKRAEGISFPPRESIGMDVAETNNKIVIEQWEDFITKETNENDESWIIKDVLRFKSLAVLGGHGKQGKSTLSMHILNLLREGKDFITKTLQAVPVIYINFEMADLDIKDLISDVMSASPGCERAAVCNYPEFPLKLETVKKILSEQEKPGVCVIDSFRGAFALDSDSENQAGVVGKILRGLQNIARETGWTIIIIHHFRKAGGGEFLDFAGSGEWLSAPDVALTWQCPEFDKPGTLKITGRISPHKPYLIQLKRECIEFLGNKEEYSEESKRKEVLTFLQENSDQLFTSETISKNTKIPEATTRRYLEDLFKEGKVIKEGEGVRGNPHLWKFYEI